MSFTQVSGTITDPGGFPYAGANLTARLVSTATPTFGASQLVDGYAALKLDANGSFSLQLADNATVSPVSSTWEFQVDTDNSNVPAPIGTGPQSFIVAGITITGAAQSLSATLSAAAPALTRIVGSGSGASAIIGPSGGQPSVLPFFYNGNIVLQVLADALNVTEIQCGNTAAPGSIIGMVCDGVGGTLIFGSADGLAIGSVDFTPVAGGNVGIQLDVGAAGGIGFYDTAPVVRPLPTGTTNGNSALASLFAALDKVAGVGLIGASAIANGKGYNADSAIGPTDGCVVISKASAAAMTLAAPTLAQDFFVLRIISASAFMHVITGPAVGFNGGGAGADVATLGGAIGDGLTLMAFNQVWLILSRTNITLS